MQTVMQDATLQIEPQGFSKQNQQFWMLQLSGWIGYAIVVFIAIIRPQFDDPHFNLSGQILNLGIEILSGFVLSYVSWLVIQRTVHLPLKKTLTISFGTAALLGIIYNVIKLASYKTVVYHQVWYEKWNMLEFGGWFLFSLSTMFIWTAIFFIMLYNNKLQKEHEMLLRAQTSAKESQLQMLRYQLNPHFMFNTMNAISTLIYKKDNDTAGEMLDKLCTFFRYSLDQKTQVESTLVKEVELLALYLSIEKVRFGERLSVIFDVDNGANCARVPALFLQPIVENAIKYGIESQKKHGIITINAKAADDKLIVSVEDQGCGDTREATPGFGIGLPNTKERLATMFNEESQISIKQSSAGTSVKIVMPFQKVTVNDE
ncbi:sensor histidine kinase [Thalassotalea hakodatensis]|uniref:sensor histidine kinase n=1 Tax=Thalassotalea hakodatensis TaxID=3030492 RepID=UPI0025733D59|nr:histidine kinase [Thalassotalea hakodatensis]